jgi:hypothetical protein
MPKVTIYTCDICGGKLNPDTLYEYHHKPGKIEYIIQVSPIVKRIGSVQSVSEPIGDMKDDFLCQGCIEKVIADVHTNKIATGGVR